jgi:hypothetical protein
MKVPSPTGKAQAILNARQPVAEYLQSIGRLEAFAGFTKDEICGLIRVAQESVEQSLHQQVTSFLNDEIPF